MKFMKRESVEAAEAELGEVLKNFRSSVHAWSEAELGRPRTALAAAHHHTWRRAAAWALGCVLAAGSLSAGLYEHYRNEHSQPAVASNEAPQPAMPANERQQPTAAAEQVAAATADTQPAAPPVHPYENLMAKVDQDVSRDVPSAMEPLAQLMDDSSSQ